MSGSWSEGAKNVKKMNEKKTIDTLRYRIKRYREMGNGAMCQDLLSELRQVIAAGK